jgi:hypothetical protein
METQDSSTARRLHANCMHARMRPCAQMAKCRPARGCAACQLCVASLRRWSVKTDRLTSSVMMTSEEVSDCDWYVLDGFSRASRKRACARSRSPDQALHLWRF